MLRTVSLIVFWLSCATLVYVYMGYPLFLFLFATSKQKKAPPQSSPLPSVTLLISAFNERAVIAQKLLNSLSIDYPRGLLQILVVSDGSDDGTDVIVGDFAQKGVQLVRQAERRGKSCGLNLGFREATGDILVFSDANAIYAPDALKHLVAHFSAPQTGYVVGNARYLQDRGSVPSADSEGLYWRFETWLKQLESAFGSVVGGDGALYAMRRELYEDLRPTDINDLLHPLQIILKGYRGLYEPAAVCYETAADSFAKEFRRKVRIVSRSFNAVLRAWPVLLPWSQFRHWICLVSHKLLRWFTPFFLVSLMVASLLLWRIGFYRGIFFLQISFYALALLGSFAKVREWRFFYLPFYFCVVNAASLLGLLKSFSGSLSSTWQTVRHDENGKPEAAVPAARRGF